MESVNDSATMEDMITFGQWSLHLFHLQLPIVSGLQLFFLTVLQAKMRMYLKHIIHIKFELEINFINC